MESKQKGQSGSIPAYADDISTASLLLSLSKEITTCRNRNEFIDIVKQKISEIFHYKEMVISLLNEDGETHSAFLYNLTDEAKNHPDYKERSLDKYMLEDGIYPEVLESVRPIILDLDEVLQRVYFPPYISFFYENGSRQMIAVALRENNQSIGGLFLWMEEKSTYSDFHINLLTGICSQISLAVSNIKAYEKIMEREREQSMLLSLSKDITSCRTKEDIQNIVKERLARYFQFTEIMICLNSDDNLTHKCYIHTVSNETMKHPDFARGAAMNYFINDGIWNVIMDSDDPVIFDIKELVKRTNKPFYVDFWHAANVKEIIGFPIRMNNVSIGGTTLYPKKKNTFTAQQLRLVQAVSSYIGIALSNILTYEKMQAQLEEISRFKSRLEHENRYLQEQIETTHSYKETIGANNGLREVFKLVSSVAPTESTVLLMGETGTGKELIARAIHNSSPRKTKLMIRVNCAALPALLIESELFGHEKGSFTGATERRIGKFELANNSTLFLDEIGEMPIELQVKLLRVIQEKEIERIGGKAVIQTDVRIIAATNRDLYKEVEAGRFRSDLFYRLNVFPITLPPLRSRMEDIPALVSHFINKFGRKSGKNIKDVSLKAIKSMMLYDWPGNVRELEHTMERSIIMTTGATINEIFLPQNNRAIEPFKSDIPGIKTLDQNERDHIINVIKRCNGKIGGESGASVILGLPPTTLHSKMKKLGIKKTDIN